ncbi:MAG: HNH endonuclease [Acidobacteriia bacterium]|nr:HNH endonuclease [Terriglobia bacterium]
MARERPAIPKGIRERVLREFNHRCAFCGRDRPQLHHIDENPANNEPLNLVPLCPSDHLTDEHDPTRRVDPAILRLFRQYRDPAILKPQFVPLFDRLRFLYVIGPETPIDTLPAAVDDLLRFVQVLHMGAYFAAKIGELLRDLSVGWMAVNASNEREESGIYQMYREMLQRNAPAVEKLVVELLRFQTWP